MWDVCSDQEAVDLVLQRTIYHKKMEKHRESAVNRASAASSRVTRRSQRSNVASINDIFGGQTQNVQKQEEVLAEVSDEADGLVAPSEKDKIPEKITEKMKAKAVSELQNSARELIDLALQRRTLDNVSVMVIWF